MTFPRHCGCAPPPRTTRRDDTTTVRQQSFRYNAKGERVDPRGGHYWIPADEFDCVVRTAQYDRRVLNNYPFEPLPESSIPSCAPRASTSRSSSPHRRWP
jgi:hypothetical protein